MIKVTEKAMADIYSKLSIDKEGLIYIGGGRGDYDGIVYTYNSGRSKGGLQLL